MELVSVKELIEAGAHLGHLPSRWNPLMKPYIFGKYNGLHIIDIRQTIKGLLTAYYYLVELARRDGLIIFVGTKPAARNVIATEALRCGMPYANERWLGGTLTNFETIRQKIDKLLTMEKQETDGTLERYTKKEQAVFLRRLKKLRRNLSGIKNLTRLPDAMIVVDTNKSKNALQEAKYTGVKTIGLVDTDGDPSKVDIPIPINDDAIKAIQVAIRCLANAILVGKSKTPVVTQLEETKETSSEIPVESTPARKSKVSKKIVKDTKVKNSE